MLKRFFLALALSVGLLAPVHGAGSISLSLTQQFDSLGKPLRAGKIYFIQAGTTSTPQSAYQDSALTLPWPNPITLDSVGRVPQLFFADGSIKIRITNSSGVVQFVQDGILVIGASSGGGGGSPVDATTVLQTGDIKARYGTGVIDGFVRANGTSIGSATSGASENASAATQALFEYLWNTDANLRVLPSRGVSAAADWAANKTIDLPDWRGRNIAGLDDMGTTAAGRLTSTYFGTAATVLGAAGGTQSHTLSLAELPTGITTSGSNSISVTNSGIITSTGTNSITASGINSITASGSNTITVASSDSINLASNGPADNFTSVAGTGQWDNITRRQITSTGTNTISVANASQSISVANASQAISVSTAAGSVTSTGTNTITGTSNNTSGNAHPVVSPAMLTTIYIKL